MEQTLLNPQVFTPGSDIAIGFRPSQTIWGRTGNDVLLGYQPSNLDLTELQYDVFLGDLAIEDSSLREGSDTFVLGDWVRPYYTNGTIADLDSNDLAVVSDFTAEQDTIQLYGVASNYQLLDTELGTIVTFVDGLTIEPIGFVLGVSDLSLSADYFEFRGSAPPPVADLPVTQQLGTTEYDIPLGIGVDPSGDVYVAGGTNGSLAAENAGLRDNFVVKYDDQGEVLFSQQFGTSEFDTIYGIDTDNKGNYYVTGVTGGDLAGDKQAEELDTFVAKYDGEGNQVWIQQIGQNVVFNAFNIAVDKEAGDVFISGADVQETLEDDTFVIKYSTDGEQQWVSNTGTSGLLSFDESYGLTVAGSGSVYAAGWTSSDLEGANEGLYDNWLAKYDNRTGEVEWTAQYGTPDYEWAWDVRTDSAENVYTAGWTLGDLEGESAGSSDAYLTKFDQTGELQWVEQFGGAGDDQAYSLYIDQSDNIFVAGYTDGDLEGENAGSYDAWVTKYDTDGKQVWINQFGTSDRDELYGIAADESGNLYATGITQGSLGGLNAGSFDGWTAKLDAETGELLNFGAEDSPMPTDSDDDLDTLVADILSQIAQILNSDEPIAEVEETDLLTGGEGNGATDDLVDSVFDSLTSTLSSALLGAQEAVTSVLSTGGGTNTIEAFGTEIDLASLADSLTSSSLGAVFNSAVLTGSETLENSEIFTTGQLSDNSFELI